MRRGLTLKIGSIVVLSQIIIVSIVGGLQTWNSVQNARQHFERHMAAPAMLLNSGLMPLVLVRDCVALAALTGEPDLEAYLIESDGSIRYTCVAGNGQKSFNEIADQGLLTRSRRVNDPVFAYSGDRLLVAAPVGDDYTLYIDSSTTQVQQAVQQNIATLLTTIIALTVVSSAVLMLSFRALIIRRVRRILTRQDQMRLGDYVVQPIRYTDEIADIQHGLNDMAEQLQRRDSILRAVAAASERFLRGHSWRDEVGPTLDGLGMAGFASRIYLYRVTEDRDGETMIDQLHRWVAPDAPRTGANIQTIIPVEFGISRWLSILQQGDCVHGAAEDFPPGERKLLHAHQVRTILLAPVRVDGILWGLIGFDDCSDDTPWTRPEIEALTSLCDSLGTAISRERMIAEMAELNRDLGVRVADRTRDLEVASVVSRQAASMLNLDELLPYTVELTRKQFGLYHVFIFLVDGDVLRLAAGTGQAGAILQQEKIAMDMNDPWGLIGLAVTSRAPALSNDVDCSPQFHYHPALPDTRSQLALPMLLRGKLIGVLDLEADTVERFGSDDLRVLTVLAQQLAVTVQNARLYAEQVRVAEEMRKLDQMKSQFLASMSHELRTPLNAIINFNGFVLNGMLGPLTDRQHDALEKVGSSSHHLLSLINDILDITKIEADMMKLFVEDDVDPATEVQAVLDTANTLLGEKPVRLCSDVASNLPLIRADRRRVRQILLNLVANACKFTEVGHVKVRVWHKSDVVTFSVADTGPGITAEEQALIFEPFHQTATGMRRSGGTGLGLPISRRLAEAHGGRLWLESIVGEGSTFYVELPVE